MANVIAPGFDAIDASGWKARLLEAAYISPSAVRLEFQYEDVERTVPLRNTAFAFPGVNGEYIQQNGFGSRRYPLRCFFSGSDHDILALQFEAALLESGRGFLHHPMYGIIQNVVPVGEIVRRDDLKRQANQSVIEVEFWTTLVELFPSTQENPESEIVSALAAFDLASAQQFAQAVDLVSAVERASMKQSILEMLDGVSGALQGVADATSTVRRGFADVQQVINRSIDVFVGQPLLLARQISDLIKFPARAASGIRSRMDGYRALAQSIFVSEKGLPANALTSGTALAIRTKPIANDFHASDLAAMNAVGGSVSSVVNHTFTTRPEASAAAIEIIDQFDEAIAWRDAGFEALEQIPRAGNQQMDTGEGFEHLRRAVALCAGHLVEVSFSLLPERVIVLDRNRTIIDLAAELYGRVDDATLTELISQNNLSRERILELQRGDRIRYYSAAA